MGADAAQPMQAPAKAVHIRPSGLDILLKPVHRWVWGDAHRRAHKLLRFAETEADGGRDLARAAELTSDALLRRLYLRHASDEQRHAEMFRRRGKTMLASMAEARAERASIEANWLAPGERGLDDLAVEREKDDTLLAFLHLSERAAAARFAIYREVLAHDPDTRDVFEVILHDEAFHMNYTRKQLERVAPQKHGVRLLFARLARLGKVYLRLAASFAAVAGAAVLTLQYFLVLPLFAFAAKRGERRARLRDGGCESHKTRGWTDARGRPCQFRSQY
jgi:rubrerythrin